LDDDPEDPIAILDLGAIDVAFENCDLLAKGDVLEGQSRSVGDHGVDECPQLGEPGHLVILNWEQGWPARVRPTLARSASALASEMGSGPRSTSTGGMVQLQNP